MNESKLKIWAKGIVLKAKQSIGPILACVVPGILIGGSLTALSDNKRIKRLEKGFKEHVDIWNGNADRLNAFMGKTNGRLEELAHQNNILFEKALKETEGKAS